MICLGFNFFLETVETALGPSEHASKIAHGVTQSLVHPPSRVSKKKKSGVVPCQIDHSRTLAATERVAPFPRPPPACRLATWLGLARQPASEPPLRSSFSGALPSDTKLPLSPKIKTSSRTGRHSQEQSITSTRSQAQCQHGATIGTRACYPAYQRHFQPGLPLQGCPGRCPPYDQVGIRHS